MHVGLALVSLAPVPLTGVRASLWCPTAVSVWRHPRCALSEGAFLQALFGDAYAAYNARVPCCLGRVRGPASGPRTDSTATYRGDRKP